MFHKKITCEKGKPEVPSTKQSTLDWLTPRTLYWNAQKWRRSQEMIQSRNMFSPSTLNTTF